MRLYDVGFVSMWARVAFKYKYMYHLLFFISCDKAITFISNQIYIATKFKSHDKVWTYANTS